MVRLPDLQGPAVAGHARSRGEALVGDVRRVGDGEQLQVAVPDPRHLKSVQSLSPDEPFAAP